MLKNKLTFLISLGILSTTTAPLLVSCGSFSVEDLATRMKPGGTEEYRSGFSQNPTSWASGIANQTQNLSFIANLQGTLVAVDRYQRVFGDLAEDKYSEKNFSPSTEISPYVGRTGINGEQKYKIWHYTISSEAQWFEPKTGKPVRQITAEDFLNTAKFVLYQKNTSAVINLWLRHIQGAVELSNKLSAMTPEEYGKFDIATDAPYFGVQANGQELTFTLTKEEPYFETLLEYTAFSPMPAESLLYSSDAGTKYGYGIDGYENVLTSGAYYVESATPSERIVLKANENYLHAQQIYIKTLSFKYQSDSSSAARRMAFEAGDIDGTSISPDDKTGWERYVGNSPAVPKFGGANSGISPNIETRYLAFNFANRDGETSDEALKTSMALQSIDVRKIISYGLNRDIYNQYFSEATDRSGSEVSSWTRNVFTPRGFVRDVSSVDYVQHVEDEYESYYNLNPGEGGEQLEDGKDAFYQNESILTNGLNLGASLYNTGVLNVYKNKIKTLKQSLKIAENTPIVIKLLVDAGANGSENDAVRRMFSDFNKNFDTADNHLIRFEAVQSANPEALQTLTNEGRYDISLFNWSPDYADPATYLNTYTIDGDQKDSNGLVRLLNANELGIDVHNEDSSQAVEIPDFENIPDAAKTALFTRMNALNSTLLKSFYNDMQSYTKQEYLADKVVDDLSTPADERYDQLAKAEVYMVYEKSLLLPMLVPNGSYSVSLSYVTPTTSATVNYGSSTYKFWQLELSARLLTNDERQTIISRYLDESDLVNTHPELFREGY